MQTCSNDENIVLFLTHGARWQDLREKMLMKHARFNKIAKGDTGLSYEPDFEANVKKCARRFCLRPVPLKGSTSVIHGSYQSAKNGIINKESKP